MDDEASEFILRVDRVGSFRLILGEAVTIGGPRRAGEAGHVALYGQLAGEHAVLRRTESGYFFGPRRGAVSVVSSDETGSGPDSGLERLLIQETCLTNDCTARLDRQVRLKVRMISPLSQTALVEIEPGDRLVDRVDGLVMMENLLLLGSGSRVHVRSPHWNSTGALVYQAGEFRLRSPVGPGVAGSSVGSGDGEDETPVVDVEVPVGEHVVAGEFGLYLERF